MDVEINNFLNSLEKNASRIVEKYSLGDVDGEVVDDETDSGNYDLVGETMDIIHSKITTERIIPDSDDIEKYIDLVLDRSVDDLNLSQSIGATEDASSYRGSMTSSMMRGGARKDGVWKRKLRTSIIHSALRSSPAKKKTREEILDVSLPIRKSETERKDEERILKSLVSQQPKEPVDSVLYYLKVLSSFPNRDYIRIEAVRRIRNIWDSQKDMMQEYSETISSELIQHCFKNYMNQTEDMNDFVIRTISAIRPDELTPLIPSLIHLLKVPSRYGLKRTIMNVLFRLGPPAFSSLLKECESPSSEWDSLILSIISNHPYTLQHVIVPALIRECDSKSMTRRLQATRAIYHLGPWAKTALPKLCEMFEHGALDRRVLASTIRRLGVEGEHTLIYCLNSNWNTRIRSCSAFALGEDIDIHSMKRVDLKRIKKTRDSEESEELEGEDDDDDEEEEEEEEMEKLTEEELFYRSSLPRNDLVVIVNAQPDTGIYFSKRRSVLKFCDQSILVFDARELIVQLNRALSIQLQKQQKKEEERRANTKNKQTSKKKDEILVDDDDDDDDLDEEEEMLYLPFSCPIGIESHVKELLQHCQTMSIDSFVAKNDLIPRKEILPTPKRITRYLSNIKSSSSSSSDAFPLTVEKNRKITSPESSESKGKRNKQHFNNRFFPDRVRPEYHRTKEVVSALNEAMEDPEEKVRYEVARTLGSASHPSSLPSLLKVLARDESIMVRGEILNSLSCLASVVTSPRMIRKTLRLMISLLDDKMYNVRYLTTRAIRSWSENFKSLLKSSPETSTSSSDRQLNRKLFQSCLERLQKGHRDGTINRNCVCRTLCSLGDLGINYLCTVVSKETSYNSKLRMSSAVGLRFLDTEFTSQVTIDRIVETLFASSSDRIPNVRLEVLYTMIVLSRKCPQQAYLQNSSLLPFFYSFLKDKSDPIRSLSAKCLAEIGDQGEMVLMESVVRDPSDLVRASSALGCGLLGAKSFRTMCHALRRERSGMVRREIVRAMRGMGWKAIVGWAMARGSKEFAKSVVEEINRVLEIHEIDFMFFLKRKIVEKL